MSPLTPPAYLVPAEATPPTRRTASRLMKLVGGVLVLLSLANFAAVMTLLVLLCIVSEDWWLSLALSYLPRVPYLFPSVMLAVAALLLRRRRTMFLNLLSALLVLGPVMGFRTPWGTLMGSGSGTPITIVSYNVQRGVGQVESVLAELIAADPDVIVLQEAVDGIQRIRDHYQDWYLSDSGEYVVFSRWPVQFREACRTEGFGRATAVLDEVKTPEGRFFLYNVHLTTARFGLLQLRTDSLVSGEGIEELMQHQDRRSIEARQTSEFVASLDPEIPLLAVGDFNMPSSSRLFQRHWSQFTSAFDSAGFGYGYTSPCNTNGNSWPRNTPWLRIDHILLSDHWHVESCWIGDSDGSDHRCIVARIRLR